MADQDGSHGVSSTEFFESIGQKAAQLGATTNGVNGETTGDDDEHKIVEEIESLCMQCHDNVRVDVSILRGSCVRADQVILLRRASPASC